MKGWSQIIYGRPLSAGSVGKPETHNIFHLAFAMTITMINAHTCHTYGYQGAPWSVSYNILLRARPGPSVWQVHPLSRHSPHNLPWTAGVTKTYYDKYFYHFSASSLGNHSCLCIAMLLTLYK